MKAHKIYPRYSVKISMVSTAKLAQRRWEEDFRREAQTDEMVVLKNHLLKLGLRNDPDSMLESTIGMVHANCAYLEIDNRPVLPFLKTQKYLIPTSRSKVKYIFTFDIYSKAHARIISAAELKIVDLADLYGHPWQDYKVRGYSSIWITRSDWKELSAKEIKYLKQTVIDDLRFDYPESELEIKFDAPYNANALLVELQDV